MMEHALPCMTPLSGLKSCIAVSFDLDKAFSCQSSSLLTFVRIKGMTAHATIKSPT